MLLFFFTHLEINISLTTFSIANIKDSVQRDGTAIAVIAATRVSAVQVPFHIISCVTFYLLRS